MCEFETKIELMGTDRDALVAYEIDFDGMPDIHAVEISRVMSFYDFDRHDIGYRRKSADITDMLDSNQMSLLIDAICDALREDEASNRIARFDLDRAERPVA